jgi:coproporphyrinogen III oxidase
MKTEQKIQEAIKQERERIATAVEQIIKTCDVHYQWERERGHGPSRIPGFQHLFVDLAKAIRGE